LRDVNVLIEANVICNTLQVKGKYPLKPSKLI